MNNSWRSSMGIAERREREKEALRTLVVEAARDILSEQGLNALSMRAIADRIEYSPATIYLYFKDKDELIRQVVVAGFERMGDYVREELIALGDGANALQEYSATGRAYARFALENTAYFRVMFELPAVPQIECPRPEPLEGTTVDDEQSLAFVVDTLREAVQEGQLSLPDPGRAALIGWGLMHGLVSLYLSGHFSHQIRSHEEFLDLIAEAQASIYQGWKPERTGFHDRVVETGVGATS